MPYRLGQAFPRPFAAYAYPRTKRKVYTPLSRTSSIVNQTVVSSATVTQSISKTGPVYQNVISTATVGYSLDFRRSYSFTIVSSASVTQTEFANLKTIEEDISHDVTIVQAIHKNVVLTLHVSSSATVGQLSLSSATSIVSSATVTQTIGVTKIVRQNVSSSATLSDTLVLRSPISMFVVSSFSAAQTVAGRNAINRQTIVSAATITESLGSYLPVKRLMIVSSATVSQILTRRNLTYTLSVISNATVVSRVNTQYNKHVEHDITVFQSLKRTRVPIIVTDTMTLSDSYTTDRQIVRVPSDHLTLAEAYTHSTTFGRVFSDSFVFIETYNIALLLGSRKPGPQPVGVALVRPIVPAIKGLTVGFKNGVIFESKYGTVITPAPELGDSVLTKNEVTIKKTMASTIYSFKKTSSQQVFKWDLRLTIRKALELQQFLIATRKDQFFVTTWTAEKWWVTLLSNPIEIATKSRSVRDIDLTIVSIEFQGVRYA